MNKMNQFVSAALASTMLAGMVLPVAGCVQNAAQQQQEQVVLQDITLAYSAVSNSFNALIASQPQLLSAAVQVQVQGYLAVGQQLVTQLQNNANNPDVWMQAESNLNNVLTLLAGFPLPPPYNVVVVAALAILPEVEAYINTQFKPVVPPTLRGIPAHRMSVDQARATLRASNFR